MKRIMRSRRLALIQLALATLIGLQVGNLAEVEANIQNATATAAATNSNLLGGLNRTTTSTNGGGDGAKVVGAINLEAAQTTPVSSEPLETAPSAITSVHQVWTSASSGSLDELSPEVISKLRQDVPFLAAYALRPRLVGAGAPPTQTLKLDTSSSNRMPLVISNTSRPKATSARQTSQGGSNLQSSTSSSLVPKLGDFSEFNVETSSTSKSEHHHRRKTSLKRTEREQDKSSGGGGALELPTSAGSSQLSTRRTKSKAKQTRRSSGSRQVVLKATGRSQKASKRNGSGRRSRVSASNRLLRGNKQVSLIKKNGRFLQEGSSEPTSTSSPSSSSSSNELDVEMQTPGSTKTSPQDGDSGVKGGGGGGNGPKKTPFFASKRPIGVAPTNSVDDKSREQDDEETNSLASGGERGVGTNEAGDEGAEGADEDVLRNVDGGELDDDEPQPKRVGDEDVEEDGDTVLVEPKSDGVDDDPPLPTEGIGESDGGEPPKSANDADDDDEEEEDKSVSTREFAGQPDATPAEGDTRGNRVDRDRPNEKENEPESELDGDANNGGQGGQGGTGQVAGAGIGATIGGSNGRGGGSLGGDGRSSQEDDNGAEERNSPGSVGDKKGPKSTGSGVEFAKDDDDQDDNARGRGGKSNASAGSSGEGDNESNQEGDLSGPFGERRSRTSTERPRGGSERGPEMDADDLDYRDNEEDNGGDRDGTRNANGNGNGFKRPSGGSSSGGGGKNDKTNDGHQTQAHGERPDAGSEHEAKEKHCDDGSYNHHDDHHGGGHGGGHHSHHDTIDWLRGAIPGEPDDDYPILSRVNATNFKCSEQKHPGYYADVESRCQIFHICQADGRQDSFLCPNGTIFSQKTLVCVWWNGFNCEDAPKLYHLNELLYKATDGNESPQSAALPSFSQSQRPQGTANGGGGGGTKTNPLKPRGMARNPAAGASNGGGGGGGEADDDSSIEGLVRMMRGRNGGASSSGGARPQATTGETIDGNDNGNGDDDETKATGERARGAPSSSSSSSSLPNGGSRRKLAPNDEASIQRKSTNLDADDVDDDSPAATAETRKAAASRIRSRENIPRRKRRASARQAPLKLKSRRVPRNSRRRKLRHGIKPRRRA